MNIRLIRKILKNQLQQRIIRNSQELLFSQDMPMIFRLKVIIINIEVNSDNEVMGFNYDYHDVDFPSNKMVSVDYAYSMLFKQKDFNYYYNGFTTLDGKSKTYLIYNMDYFYMNAKNGKLVDSEGNEITETS
jgi:hypothetical protein